MAKPGTNLITAAKTVGADIPYYCYHHRLSIAANCRMCLVESSNSPKLVPGCQTPVSEGMAIQTDSRAGAEASRAVLEFLLLNHPVDCAICDQAGECKLARLLHELRPQALAAGRAEVLRAQAQGARARWWCSTRSAASCARAACASCDEVAKEPQLGRVRRAAPTSTSTSSRASR